jgi:hypothetical protein
VDAHSCPLQPASTQPLSPASTRSPSPFSLRFAPAARMTRSYTRRKASFRGLGLAVALVAFASSGCLGSSMTTVRLKTTNGLAAEATSQGRANTCTTRGGPDDRIHVACGTAFETTIAAGQGVTVDRDARDVLSWEGERLRVRGVAYAKDGTRIDLIAPMAAVSEVRDQRSVNRATGFRALLAGLLFTVAGGALLLGGSAADGTAPKTALYGSGGIIGGFGLLLDVGAVAVFLTPTWDRVPYPAR